MTETLPPLPPDPTSEQIIERHLAGELLQSRYTRWLKDAPVDRWESYVKDIEDPHVRSCVAALLENQRLFNEIATHRPTETQADAMYKVIVKTFSTFLVPKIVSFQTLNGPSMFVYNHEVRYTQPEDPTLSIRWPNEGYLSENECSPVFGLELIQTQIIAKSTMIRINESIENIDAFSNELRKYIEHDVLKDIRNNCGTVMSIMDDAFEKAYDDFDYYEEDPLHSKIFELIHVIERKTLRNENHWIIVSPDMYKKHLLLFKRLSTNLSIHVSDNYTHEDILIGTRGEDFTHMGGYFYCPYVALCNLENGPQWMYRYGKKLTQQGPKSYARIQRAKD